MSVHSRRAGRALRALAEADPALGALSLWCSHRDGAVPLAATRGETVMYGAGFGDLSAPEQMGIAAHHILHVAFRHGPRADAMARRLGPGFDRELFNIAADALVNETVLLAGFVLPRPRITLTVLLAGALGLEETAPGAVADWDVEKLYVRLISDTSGADGQASETARRMAKEAGFDGDLEPEDTAADGTAPTSDWHGRLARALAEGRSAGRGLGVLSGRLGDLPSTETPWERHLRSAVTRCLTQDRLPQPYRPARRWLAMDADARMRGLPSPGFVAASGRPRETARLAVLIDASGSVPPGIRDRFAGEVAGIAARTGAEVHLVVFDAEVRETRSLPAHATERALRELDWPEGGGTDFAPAFEAARAADPAIIVVLTDLEGDPGAPPGKIPVIWATPGAPPAPPPYGRHIVLDR